MKNNKLNNEEALSKISKDRARTNITKKYEQQLIAYLVQRVPSWMTSNMLTGIGFAGTLIVTSGFILGAFVDRAWLLLNIPGFMISWLGDSLDGRLAYYRNKARKWYGFSLDLIVDWFSTIGIGVGFVIYAQPEWKFIGYTFVFLYGWSMMMALLRYKITNKYSIDSGYLGPTELRMVISLIITLEVFFENSIIFSGLAACVVLLIINITDFVKLLRMGDVRDKEEKGIVTSKEATIRGELKVNPLQQTVK